ncbi:MAG: hypothetical protein L6Q73_15860 [Aquabacterium sp.]|nr:hypothetical protein [Aquabacterium sp.]
MSFIDGVYVHRKNARGTFHGRDMVRRDAGDRRHQSVRTAACAQAAGCAFVWFSGGYGGARPQAVAAQIDALDGVIELLARVRRWPEPVSSGQRR